MTDQPTPTTTPAAQQSPATETPATITPAATAIAGQAAFGQRAGAYLIDCAVMMGIIIALSFTVGMVSSMLGTVASLAGMAYMLTRDSLPFLDGQSVGKKALGLRAVTTDGQSLSGNWQPGLIRNAILVIPVMGLVEAIILFTKQDAPEGLLRLGDQWAGTKVITVAK